MHFFSAASDAGKFLRRFEGEKFEGRRKLLGCVESANYLCAAVNSCE